MICTNKQHTPEQTQWPEIRSKGKFKNIETNENGNKKNLRDAAEAMLRGQFKGNKCLLEEKERSHQSDLDTSRNQKNKQSPKSLTHSKITTDSDCEVLWKSEDDCFLSGK